MSWSSIHVLVFVISGQLESANTACYTSVPLFSVTFRDISAPGTFDIPRFGLIIILAVGSIKTLFLLPLDVQYVILNRFWIILILTANIFIRLWARRMTWGAGLWSIDFSKLVILELLTLLRGELEPLNIPMFVDIFVSPVQSLLLLGWLDGRRYFWGLYFSRPSRTLFDRWQLLLFLIE